MPRTLTFDDYEITKDGQVINKITGRALKPQPNNKGYLRVQLCKKFLFVHRLVAEKYIPNPNNLPQVNHIDGNKLNNSVENLEWISNQDNRTHAVKNGLHLCGEKVQYAILTEDDVRYIREHAKEKLQREWAEEYGVSPSTIADVIHYRTWKNVK